MGSCFVTAVHENHKRPSKLKVYIPKNPLLETNPIYEEMPFDQGDCVQENKNPFNGEYKLLDQDPFFQSEHGTYLWHQSIKTETRRLVKVIKKNPNPKSDEPVRIISNIMMMKYLDHPNIIKIVEFFNEKDFYYIVFEDYHGQNMLLKIDSPGNQEQKAALIIEQILHTFSYLHSKKIIYRMLCPQYLFCNDSLTLMFIEFGDAKPIKENTSTPKGDLHFQSPEMLTGRYDWKSDVWAVGVMLYFLLSGAFPFEGSSVSQIQGAVLRGIPQLDAYDLDKVPEAKQFLLKLLTFASRLRPTTVQALQDKWINKAKSQKNQIKMSQALVSLRKFKKCEVLVEAIIMQIVHMTLTSEQKMEIKRVFDEFDTNCDGRISTQELLEGNAVHKYRGYKKYQTSTKLEKQDIESLIKRIDSNGNGFLDFTEFLLACQDKKHVLTVEKLKLLFAQLDADRDNTLSMKEMRRIFGGNKISDENWNRVLQKTNLQNKSILSESEFLEFVSKAIKTSDQ